MSTLSILEKQHRIVSIFGVIELRMYGNTKLILKAERRINSVIKIIGLRVYGNTTHSISPN